MLIDREQRLLQCVSPMHGRVLIYVWAIEQDELSKRNVPTETQHMSGQDVFVPWVMSQQNPNKKIKPRAKSRRDQDSCDGDSASNSYGIVDKTLEAPMQEEPHIFNRYYHMFAKGELVQLVRDAASELGLHVGPRTDEIVPSEMKAGMQIVQYGWERSNYYVELRRWTM